MVTVVIARRVGFDSTTSASSSGKDCHSMVDCKNK